MRSNPPRRRRTSRLFAVYAAASLVPVIALGALLAASYRSDGNRAGLAEARNQARVLSDDVVAPALGTTRLQGSLPTAAQATLASVFAQAKHTERLVRMRVRDVDGVVVWSDDGSGFPAAGKVESDDDEVDEALNGDVVSLLTRLNADVDDSGPLGPRVVEIYRPIMAVGAEKGAPPVGVLEMYLPYAPIEADVSAGLHHMYEMLAIGLAVLWLVLALISASTTNRLRKQSERLAYLAHHDEAFGLLNRVGFANEVAERLAQDPHKPPAVALVNVSRFREINEALGRPSGDEVLLQLGRRLSAAAGDSAVVGRLGGDEFGVACFAHRGDLDGWAAELQATVSEPIEADGVPVLVELAVGYDRGEPEQGVDVLLNRADAALVQAKSAADRRAAYSSARARAGASSVALLARLRTAIPRGDLELHYQPKTALADGHLVSVEALVRWRLDGQLLAPQQFLPSAEQTTLIHPLTDWVVREALNQLSAWAGDADGIDVAVNVSARNLSDPSFADRLLDIVADSGVDPRRLTVEITETALLDDPDAARVSLVAMHEAGISVSIDDFGQGQTSLAYLASLPIDELKIDRAFVAQVCTDPTQDAIVRSVIQLGHSLGLQVVAEGIEDEPTIERLADLGADIGQGYFIARPMHPQLFGAWRAERDAVARRVVGAAGL
jgi:diguanylate cyclase (GGDEF)-like protein